MVKKQLEPLVKLRNGRWTWGLITLPALFMAFYAAAYFVAGEEMFPDQVASWLSWVLNLLWVEAYLRRSTRRPSVRRALADLSVS